MKVMKRSYILYIKGIITLEKWKVRYKDNNYDIDTYIENNYNKEKIPDSLTMTIDGIKFCGMSFSDFEVYDENSIEDAKEKFKVLKWGGATQVGKTVIKNRYVHWLQDYYLEVEIPVKLINIEDDSDISAIIHFAYQMKEDVEKSRSCYHLDNEVIYSNKVECIFFQLEASGIVCKCEYLDLDFETSLLQICNKIKEKYLLKCCFGCLYADYSPYGNDEFATMLCYSSCADKYIQVSGKYGDDKGISIWEVYDDGEQKQETFLCKKFKPRINCLGGYRGNIYL